MNASSFDRQEGSTRGFTTLDPERQGVLASLVHPGPLKTLPAPGSPRKAAPRAATVGIELRSNDSRCAAPSR